MSKRVSSTQPLSAWLKSSLTSCRSTWATSMFWRVDAFPMPALSSFTRSIVALAQRRSRISARDRLWISSSWTRRDSYRSAFRSRTSYRYHSSSSQRSPCPSTYLDYRFSRACSFSSLLSSWTFSLEGASEESRKGSWKQKTHLWKWPQNPCQTSRWSRSTPGTRIFGAYLPAQRRGRQSPALGRIHDRKYDLLYLHVPKHAACCNLCHVHRSW